MKKFIVPKHTNLSLEEIGLLTTMLNVDEADYCTIEELCKFTSDKIVNIISVLKRLCSSGYVKSCNQKYFINKEKIFEMKLVG